MKRYNIPADVPVDEYGHVKGGETDPYGHLEYVIGADDFVCLDYSFETHAGRTLCILHATLNNETGHSIEDYDYVVVDCNNPEFRVIGGFETQCLVEALGMVNKAIEWGFENQVKHDKTGWNQDPYYFVRALAKELDRMDSVGVGLSSLRDSRAFRFGNKKVNKLIFRMADHNLFYPLPVTRRPKRESFAF